MPKLDAPGVLPAVASTVLAPIATPRMLSMVPTATATTPPARTAPQEIRGGSAGAPSGATVP